MIDTPAFHKMLLIFNNVTNTAQPKFSWDFWFLIAPMLYI